ncbi:terminase small subunit [Ruminococcus callidus]|uniref:terminase small subunit n=1 Tax=Ruminococcus callidus TaxID=40519 RepID=UPI0023F34274|nr:terminase small subunit [Ruminococcus callidus]
MLTEQRKRFVEEYVRLRCKNQQQAAINAGYSPKSAAQQACDLLKNPEVQEYLQKQKSALIRRIQEELVLSASDAVSTVYDIMKDADARDADRLKAAFDILDRAGFRPEDKNTGSDTETELPKLLEALEERQ